MSLGKKAVAGFLWTFTQQFSTQIINFIVQTVLARILAPKEFGLIGMLSIFISIGQTLMDSGLTASLIRTENVDQKDYSTVFFINIIGSILFYVILFAGAPFIADFYSQSLLTPLVRVYALTFIIQAFIGVQSARLTQQMDFKTQLTIQIPSLIGGGILGVVLAKLGYGVWSLVWMNLFQSFLSTIQHWVYSGWRPNFIFDKARFKYHFNFGYKMTISGLIETIYNNIYTIVIGKYFSAVQVGYYTRSLGLRQLPISNLSTAINKVTYPMFSSIQGDNVKLKIAYKRVLRQMVFWITPILILLAVIANPFIKLLLTEKWLPAVPYFQILCISGIMYPLKFNLNIIKVKGESALRMKLEMVKKSYGIAAIFFAVRYGIFGLLYCQLILDFLEYFVNSFYSGRLINYSMKEQIKDVLPSLFVAGVVGFLAYLLDSYVRNSFHPADIVLILTDAGFYLILYFGLCTIFKFQAISDFKLLVLKK